jgi:hypothetical protein
MLIQFVDAIAFSPGNPIVFHGNKVFFQFQHFCRSSKGLASIRIESLVSFLSGHPDLSDSFCFFKGSMMAFRSLK